MVLAARIGLGVMLIRDADQELDQVSSLLGPQRYRLRGGGPSSHRGFAPGFLGDEQSVGVQPVCERSNPPPGTDCSEANSGGLRRWEASLELRAPITPDFGMVLFADAGDVNRGTSFRFNHIHLAVGFGFRYQTLVGPIRLDIGVLSRRAQVLGDGVNLAPVNYINLGFARFPGAIHLTIGEAF
jgi:translocation and assembly module TamA